GPRINRDLWLKTGDRSRLAAFIHEAFRNYQINYEGQYVESDLDRKIEVITNLLVMHSPSELKEHLDYTKFFDGELLDWILRYDFESWTFLETYRFSHPDKILTAAEVKRFVSKEIEDKWNQRTRDSAFKIWYDVQHMGDRSFDPETQIQKWEDSIRAYLRRGRTNEGSEGDWKAEILIRAMTLYNHYIQDRWYEDAGMSFLIGDLKNLMSLQENNPKINIFDDLEKYHCYSQRDWNIPIDKVSRRQNEDLEQLRMKRRRELRKCNIEVILRQDPRLIIILEAELSDDPQLMEEIRRDLNLP
ncbi:MAG TPA: hypothetical protein VN132_06690, partial [Bdellovibrio sp.]|nr:hypothetical protein [Bdellovibrio sp.]